MESIEEPPGSDQKSDFISRALGFGPDISSSSLNWDGVSMFAWRGYAESCSYETSNDFVIVYHTGGAEGVPVTANTIYQPARSRPGLITLIPPHTLSRWEVNGKVHSYSIHLPRSLFESTARTRKYDPSQIMRLTCCVQDMALNALLDALADEMRNPSQIGPLYVESMATSIALYLGRRAERQMDMTAPLQMYQRKFHNILEKIDANLDRALTLDELASDAGMSRAHFIKSFRRLTGATPHQFLIGKRVKLAASLIQSTELPLCEIALRSGFSSQSHLTETFRKVMGTTPFQYRRAYC